MRKSSLCIATRANSSMRGCTKQIIQRAGTAERKPAHPLELSLAEGLTVGGDKLARPLSLVVIGERVRAVEQRDVVGHGVDIGLGYESLYQRPTVVLPLSRRRGELVVHDRRQTERSSTAISCFVRTIRADLFF